MHGLNTERGEGTELEFLEGTGKGDEKKKKLSIGGGWGNSSLHKIQKIMDNIGFLTYIQNNKKADSSNSC